MAQPQIPKLCLAVQMNPTMWCHIAAEREEVVMLVKKEKEKIRIPQQIWEALAEHYEILCKVFQLVQRHK